MGDRQERRERKKVKRQEILERLNSFDEDLGEEARWQEEKSERERRHERELELEKGKRHPGF